MARQVPEWERDIERELVLKQCRECGNTANWERTYAHGEDLVDVFVCRSCGHAMHISREPIQVVQPERAE